MPFIVFCTVDQPAIVVSYMNHIYIDMLWVCREDVARFAVMVRVSNSIFEQIHLSKSDLLTFTRFADSNAEIICEVNSLSTEGRDYHRISTISVCVPPHRTGELEI